MKKLLAILSAITVLLALAGCGTQENKNSSPKTDGTSSNNSVAGSSQESLDTSSDKNSLSSGGSQNTSDTSATNAKITAEQAKEIAFKDAGVKESDVYDLEIDLDRDGSILHYDIDFESGGKDYEYDISAFDGSILLSSPNNQKPSDNSASQSTSSQTSLITKDQAKAIAFKDAGVNEKDIFGLEIDLDRDGGVVAYEIEFQSGRTEYHYDIHAYTGAIINSEKEFDD